MEHGGTVVTLEGRAVGALLPRLFPLLDGTRTVDELVTELGVPVAPAVEHALSLLDANRLLLEGREAPRTEVGLRAGAAYACAFGRRTTEDAAVRRLEEASVAIVGSGRSATVVAAQLEELGVGTVVGIPVDTDAGDAFVVAAPAAHEVSSLAELNARALATGAAWLQLLPFDGRVTIAGPLFLPGGSACRTCFVTRRGACSGYEEDFDVVEREPHEARPPAPLTAIAAGLAAIIALRWIATGDPTLPGRFYAIESGAVLRLTHAHALRVPRCRACGAPERAVPSPWFEESS